MLQETSSALEQIELLIGIKTPILWVTTFEEDRFLKTLYIEVAEKQDKELWTWSAYQGLIKYDPKELSKKAEGEMERTQTPPVALSKIEGYSSKRNGAIWVLKDFNTVLSQPIPRILRDIYRTLIRNNSTIIIMSPDLSCGNKSGLEITLEKQISIIPYDLPSRITIEKRVQTYIKYSKKHYEGKELQTKLDYTDEEFHRFSIALQGLTEIEIDQAIKTSLLRDKKLDEKKLLSEKRKIIQKSEILEYINQTPSIDEVGGLDSAKEYFKLYNNQFTEEAKKYGVEPLKGVLLTGVPGTGKSLLAKAIAAIWNLPLLRLDVGKVMTGLVGGSEEKMRLVIQQAESIAPAILWIDEIEKSLSGTKSSGFSDGGTLSRVFGTLLTAMEERMQDIVVIATANDIQALPPELIRRFNEVMFVDLPVPSEREEIFGIHFKKRGRNIKKLNLNMKELIAASHQFTGSEIEKAVKESIARAYVANKQDVEQEDILGAIKDTKCIAKVMADKINEIREWARNKARYASSLAAEAAMPGNQKVMTKSGKELSIGEDLDKIEETKQEKKKALEKIVEEAEFNNLQDILDD